jgi:hypothetical protein
VRTIERFGSQYSLSKLTSSVTEAGVILDQTQSNSLYQSLAASWESLAEETAQDIEAQGTTITIDGYSVVKVYVTKDAELWQQKQHIIITNIYKVYFN